MLGGARLSLSDPALLMASVRIASTYGASPSRRQLPSRFRPGSPWLHPTVGRSKRTAAVNRPARMNAQRGAFCSRTDGVVLSQVQYSWKNGRVACPGLCLRTTMPRSRPSSRRLGAVLRSLIEMAISGGVLPFMLREYPDPVIAQLFSSFFDLSLQFLDLGGVLFRPTTQKLLLLE
jgi:hypothetical protein